MMFKKILSNRMRLVAYSAPRDSFTQYCYLLYYKDLRCRPTLASICCVILFPMLSSICGCRSLPPIPAANLSEQGWTIRHGQAVWRRARGAPEIAGELLVGTRTNGDALVQFNKTPFPVVIVQKTSTQWQIQAPTQNETHVGPGNPPGRVIWFRLAEALTDGTLPQPWLWRTDLSGWSLENRASGESLSGYFLEGPGGAASMGRQ
jgi:hypothetical protein